MKRFSLTSFVILFSFSIFSQSYTYVVGDFGLCGKNFEENMVENEMGEVAYRVYAANFYKVPAGTYEFFIHYYSVYYGSQWVDASHSTPGYFTGNTARNGNYAKSNAIAFTIDTVSNITIKFDRNTNMISLISTSEFVKEGRPFYYLNYNDCYGSAESTKVYTNADDEVEIAIPFRQGSNHLRIAKDYDSPLQVDSECSNISTRGANPINFYLSEPNEVTIKIKNDKICLSIPIKEPLLEEIVDSVSINNEKIDSIGLNKDY